MQGSLKAIAWLLGFRISLLVYYATRVLLAEIDREQHQPRPVVAGSGPSESLGSSVGDTNGRGSDNASGGSEGSRAKCALCMDPMNAPAVIPCGHIFCWGCVVAHVRSSSRRGGSGSSAGGGMARCPMCRHRILGQRVRALYK